MGVRLESRDERKKRTEIDGEGGKDVNMVKVFHFRPQYEEAQVRKGRK